MPACPQCGASTSANERECKYCGETLNFSNPNPPTPPVGFNQPPVQVIYQQPPQPIYVQTAPPAMYKDKSKVAAGVLGIILGGIGAHKFYLGKIWIGILYLVFCWTWIPSIVGFIEGIMLLCMNDYTFMEKYCRIGPHGR